MGALRYIVLAIAVLMYLLVILFQNKKVWFTSFAAAVVIILGIIFPGQIFDGSQRLFALTHSLFQIINWNVIMIYLGSMTIAALFLYSNVPARIADGIINNSKSRHILYIVCFPFAYIRFLQFAA